MGELKPALAGSRPVARRDWAACRAVAIADYWRWRNRLAEFYRAAFKRSVLTLDNHVLVIKPMREKVGYIARRGRKLETKNRILNGPTCFAGNAMRCKFFGVRLLLVCVALMAAFFSRPAMAQGSVQASIEFSHYWGHWGFCTGQSSAEVMRCEVQAWAGSQSIVSGCAETSRYVIPGSTGLGGSLHAGNVYGYCSVKQLSSGQTYTLQVSERSVLGVNIRNAPVCPSGSVWTGDATYRCSCNAGSTSEPASNSCMPAPEDATCTVGNPALPGSGVKLHSETDYEGAGSSPMLLQRFYRSRFSAAEIPNNKKWSHTYSARLYRSPLPRDLAAMRSDGSIWRFQFDPVALKWSSSETRSHLTESRNTQGISTGFQLLDFSNDSTETYDAAGKLLSIRQRNGWTTTLQYDTQQMLASVTNHFGRQLTFTHDEAGRMTSMTAPGGEITRYGHDTVGNLNSVTWPDGNTKRYHYEDSRHPRALTGITDELGNRIGTYTYDAQGRVIETQRAGGVDRYQLAYSQDANGLPQTRVTDFSTGTPTSRTYNFVAKGRVLRPAAVSAPCPLCGSTAKATQYNAAGNKTREVAHDGQVTFHLYNAKGQETERATYGLTYGTASTRPALSLATAVVSTQWHATWNLPTQIAQPGQISSYSYDAKGMLTGLSTVVTTDTTGAASFSAITTGPVRATDYGYNANSLNTSIVEQSGGVETQRWTLAYNASGDLNQIADVTGAQSAMLTNDAHGRLTRLAASNGAVATFAWNADGQMTAATLPGYSASFTYTTQKRLNEVRLDTGEWLRVTYNGKGEPTQVLNSSGQVQTVSGLSQHWLQSDQPLNALQTLLARSLERGPQRLGDFLIKSAMAQVPVPPMPSGLVGGLAAAGGAASRGADDRPAAGACCGGGMPTDREIQERFQRTLPFTLMQGAVGVMDALTQDILTMKGRSDLRKRMQCPTEAYYQPLPPGCWEAHHIVAFADRRANASRTILRNVGIDINSPANGVWMACNKHRGMHTDRYYEKVENRLTNTSQDKLSIEKALANIRAELQSGTF